MPWTQGTRRELPWILHFRCGRGFSLAVDRSHRRVVGHGEGLFRDLGSRRRSPLLTWGGRWFPRGA